MKLETSVFKGAIRAIEDHRLGNEYAVEAVNCDLRTGALVPIIGKPDTYAVPGATKKIHLWGTKLACFEQKDIFVLPHPNNDNLIWTGSAYGAHPRQASAAQFFGTGSVGLPVASSRFGVDQPPSAPLVRVLGTASGDLIRSTAYRFSAVAATGEESDLSLPSAIVDVYIGQQAEIYRLWPTAEVPEFVGKIRIYRAETDQYGVSSWAFVVELPAATTKYTDVVEDSGEVAPSDGWQAPVNFEGLVNLGNEIMAGWNGRDLFLSEVSVPSAFPEKYKQRTNAPIKGIGVTGGYAIILTDETPYMLSAPTPEAAAFTELQFNAACLSARSVVSTNLGVIFASHDGLMMISSGGVPSNLTAELLSREQWLALDPSNMVSVVHDDKVHVFCYGRAVGLVFDLQTRNIYDLEFPWNVYDAHINASGDRILVLDNRGFAGPLGAGEALQYRWLSGLWLFAKAETLTMARLVGDQTVTNPVVFTLFRDGSPVFTKAVTSQTPFHLPPGLFMSAQYQLTGTAKVRVVQIVSDPGEF